MQKEDCVLVPKSDIESIERARKQLIDLCEDNEVMFVLIGNISGAMWRLTHKRYKEKKKSLIFRIKQYFINTKGKQ